MTRRTRPVLSVLLAAAAGVLVLVPAPRPTGATYTDTAEVTGGTLTAHTVASQAQPTCADVNGLAVLGNVARVTWTQVDARYDYAWELRSSGGSLVTSGSVGAGTPAGGTVTLDIGTGLLAVDGVFTLVVRARVAGSPTWTAATTTSTTVRRATLLVIGLAVRCGSG